MAHEVSHIDLVMDAFRKLFPLIGCTVERDGGTMRYALPRRNAAEVGKRYEGLAKLIIQEEKLPLRSEVNTWETGGVVFENTLIITYEPN